MKKRERPRPCGDLALPHGLAYTRRYTSGWKCDRHTPSAWKGLPEAPPGPGWPPGNYLNHPDRTDRTDPPGEQEP